MLLLDEATIPPTVPEPEEATPLIVPLADFKRRLVEELDVTAA